MFIAILLYLIQYSFVTAHIMLAYHNYFINSAPSCSLMLPQRTHHSFCPWGSSQPLKVVGLITSTCCRKGSLRLKQEKRGNERSDHLGFVQKSCSSGVSCPFSTHYSGNNNSLGLFPSGLVVEKEAVLES